TRHHVLVAGHDVALFRQFQSARRVIIDEREILPGWLRAFRDPFSLFTRHVWLSLRLKPLRGWHVQQLRRIAVAAFVEEEAMFFCDSAVVFVRPFDCSSLCQAEGLRFLRRPHALRDPALAEQRVWSRNSAAALGIPQEPPSEADYIATCIAWRRDAVLAM